MDLSIGGVFNDKSLGKALSRIYPALKRLKSEFSSVPAKSSQIDAIIVSIIENGDKNLEVVAGEENVFQVAFSYDRTEKKIDDFDFLRNIAQRIFRAILLCPLADVDRQTLIQKLDAWADGEGFTITRTVWNRRKQIHPLYSLAGAKHPYAESGQEEIAQFASVSVKTQNWWWWRRFEMGLYLSIFDDKEDEIDGVESHKSAGCLIEAWWVPENISLEYDIDFSFEGTFGRFWGLLGIIRYFFESAAFCI